MGPMNRALLLAIILLGGCAPAGRAGPQEAVRAVPPPVAEAGRAERIALALAAADAGAHGAAPADRAALEAALLTLDGLGAAPAEGTADPLPGWRAQLPPASPATRPMRGRALGAAYRAGWVEAGESIAVEQIFLAGQPARAALATAVGGALRLSVHGRDERPVCAVPAGGGACQWLPPYTERYALRVSNASGARLRYFLVVE